MRENPIKPAESTTARVAEILLAFAGAERPLGVTEVARSTGLSKAVAYRILQELCRSSFLWHNGETKKYQPGMSAFAFTDAANQTSQFRSLGVEMLADLAELTGETATLSGRIGHRRVYIAQVESAQLVRISVEVGTALPLSVGASGAAILAFLPENEIVAALRAPVPAISALTVTDPAAVRARLRQVAEDGYARTESERVADSTSLAAPVRNRFNEVIGCMSVAALSSRLNPKRKEQLAEQVMTLANNLSSRLAR
jgi:IclR family acetate operon transcriptional repressor